MPVRRESSAARSLAATLESPEAGGCLVALVTTLALLIICSRFVYEELHRDEGKAKCFQRECLCIQRGPERRRPEPEGADLSTLARRPSPLQHKTGLRQSIAQKLPLTAAGFPS